MDRRDPMQFATLQDAKDYAIKHQTAIWAVISSVLYHVYPGGRIVSYRAEGAKAFTAPTD